MRVAIRNQTKTAIFLFLLVRWSNCYSFWHNFGRRKKTGTIWHNKKLAFFSYWITRLYLWYPIYGFGNVHSLENLQFNGKCYRHLNTDVEGVSNSLNILRIKLQLLPSANQYCKFMCAYLCSKSIKQTIFKQGKHDQLFSRTKESRDNVKRNPTCEPRLCQHLSIS